MHENLKSVQGRPDSIVEKGEIAGLNDFLLFPQCFQKASFKDVKSWDCVSRV